MQRAGSREKQMIISFLNQKGGVGKTTLAINVGGELSRRGKRVLMIDADPQESALDWASAREGAPAFPVVGQPRPTIHREIEQLRKGYNFVIIDGPPRVTELAQSIIMASDLAIIPVQPSPYDLWAAEEVVRLLKEYAILKPDLVAAFAVNRKIVNSAIGRDVAEGLEAHGLHVFETQICQRVIFAESAANGKLVYEIDAAHQGSAEIESLTNEIMEVLK